MNPSINVVPICTDGFFSKWGFEDGDVLDDALYEMGWGDAYQTAGFDFDHDVLVAVLDRYVVPAVRQNHELTVTRIYTIHNPYRAETFDGKDVRGFWFNPDFSPPVTPEIVDVPWSVIADIASEVYNRVGSTA